MKPGIFFFFFAIFSQKTRLLRFSPNFRDFLDVSQTIVVVLDDLRSLLIGRYIENNINKKRAEGFFFDSTREGEKTEARRAGEVHFFEYRLACLVFVFVSVRLVWF